MNTSERGFRSPKPVAFQGGQTDDDGGKIGRILVADDDPTMREMILNYIGEHVMGLPRSY